MSPRPERGERSPSPPCQLRVTGDRATSDPMNPLVETLLQFKLLAVGLWFALFFVLERLRPSAPQRLDTATPAGPRAKRDRLSRNAGLWLTTAVLSPLMVVPVSIWATGVDLGWSALDWRAAAGLAQPAGGAFWLGLAIDILLLDLFIYWWHRANHEIPLLWRFHEVHHLDRHLDTTTAVRFHWGEVLLSAGVRAVVIIALDIPLASVLVFETFVLIGSIFHHSNVKLPRGLERSVGLVFITPAIHWVHHHAIRRDTDSNYGTLFSFWDLLFRSRSRTVRTPTMEIGAQGRPEKRFWRLMIAPFGKQG